MGKVKSICVYCASREGKDPALKEAALQLGKLLAEQNITLVYGGSKIGLMGAMADSVLEHGGNVTGIIPEVLVTAEKAHTNLTEQHIVDSMHSRKMMMAEKSDAFLVLPGGFGTMDETFEIITWKYIGLHNKPVVILNLNGFYEPFKALTDHFVEQHVATDAHTNGYCFADTLEEALEAIQNQAQDNSFADTELM